MPLQEPMPHARARSEVAPGRGSLQGVRQAARAVAEGVHVAAQGSAPAVEAAVVARPPVSLVAEAAARPRDVLAGAAAVRPQAPSPEVRRSRAAAPPCWLRC